MAHASASSVINPTQKERVNRNNLTKNRFQSMVLLLVNLKKLILLED
jgi:hypothetical protein